MRNLTFSVLLLAAPAAAAPALDSARAALASGGNHAYDGMTTGGSAVAFAAPSSQPPRFDKPEANTPSLKADLPSRGLAKSRGRRAGFFKRLAARCNDCLDGTFVGGMIGGAFLGFLAGVLLAESATIGSGILVVAAIAGALIGGAFEVAFG